MRVVLVTLFAVLCLAGCVSPEKEVSRDEMPAEPEPEVVPAMQEPPPPMKSPPPAVEPEEALEEIYYGRTLPFFQPWDKTHLEVWVWPLAGSVGLNATLDAIHHWREAMRHGSEDVQRITFHVTVVGERPLGSPDANLFLTDNETRDSFIAERAAPFVGVCNAGVGVNASMSYGRMFSEAAEQFAHCLGVGSIVDSRPWYDLLSYHEQTMPSHATPWERYCVSSLNLAVVHEAFAPAFGRAMELPLEFSSRDYKIYGCGWPASVL